MFLGQHCFLVEKITTSTAIAAASRCGLCVLIGRVGDVERLVANVERVHVLVLGCAMPHYKSLGEPNEATGFEIANVGVKRVASRKLV